MSVSKWRYTSTCDGQPCPGDCDMCDREADEFGKWIPCSERLPDKTGDYLTFDVYGNVYTNFWGAETQRWGHSTITVQAWMPMPEPYQGENDD